MTKPKENRGFSNFGFSTILLSFVMICVVTFSALALVTANSDYKLSKKVAAKTVEYYAAQERAYERLAALDELFINCYFTSTGEDAYFGRIEAHSRDYGTFLTDGSEYYLLFEEPIAEDQHLSVKLKLKHPMTEDETFFEIVEWKSVYTREIPDDTFLDLIQ